MDKLISLFVDTLTALTGNKTLAMLLVLMAGGGAYGGYFLYDKIIQSIEVSNKQTVQHIDRTHLEQLELELKVLNWERKSYGDEVPDYLHYKIDEWELIIEQVKRKMRVLTP